MKGYFIGNQCGILLEDISNKMLEKIKNETIITSKNFIGGTVVVALWKESGGYIWIPRLYGHTICKPHSIDMTYGDDINIDRLKVKNYKLLDIQLKLNCEMIYKYYTEERIKNGIAGCICDLATGCGKSFIGMSMFRYFKKKAVWFTNTDINTRQIISMFHKFLPDITVSDIKTDGWKNVDCLVATVHSFVLPQATFRRTLASSKNWIDSIGMVIYDEIHTLGGKEFSTIFDILAPRIQFGLSATPTNRTDYMYTKYLFMVGPVHHSTIPPPKFNGKVFAIKYFNKDTDKYRKWYTTDVGLNTAKTVRCITSDPKRRDVLLMCVKDALKYGPVIILCKYHDEMEIVTHHLTDLIEEKVYEVSGSTPPMGVINAINEAVVLVGNQKIFTGFSEERFTNLILWSTIKNEATQAIGRIKRYSDGNDELNNKMRRVYDILDVGTLSETQFKTRRKAYEHEGWDIGIL